MGIQFNLKSGGCASQCACLDKFGCISGVCPDFTIRRHDTKPSFKVTVEDCNGPLDLNGLVVEASMWALGKLKSSIAADDTYFSLADNIGFQQVMMGDIIIMERVRSPEHMLVTGFDEDNNLVRVQRGYHGTTASAWKKGNVLRIFRIMGSPADSEMSFDDVQSVEGHVDKDVLQSASLVYDWSASDTCLPGCYWFEFKLLKMIDVTWYLPGNAWTGPTNTYSDGFFYTGTNYTDSSVRLSYDQIKDKYFLSNKVWTGALHVNSDSNYYTGSAQDDGSVVLSKTAIPLNDTNPYNNLQWFVVGGDWSGKFFTDVDNFNYTGSSYTDGSVRLFYSTSNGMYYSNHVAWYGAVHEFDGIFYTGSFHNDGSVAVEKVIDPLLGGQIPWNEGWGDIEGGMGMSPSITPSFTNISLTPVDYGCILGEGVEWVRRFPIEGEGFLIRIVNSSTTEL